MLWNILLLGVLVFGGYAVYAYYRQPAGTVSPAAKVGGGIVAALAAGAAWLYAFFAGFTSTPV